MKKLFLLLAVVALAGLGWWLWSQPAGAPPEPDNGTDTNNGQKKTDATFNWQKHTGEVRSLLGKNFSQCQREDQESDFSGDIMETKDVTGDGKPEAMITTGCLGAYTTEMALFMPKNDGIKLAEFVNKAGNKKEKPVVFASGASVMNMLHFGLDGKLNTVYQAQGSARPEKCTIEWNIQAYTWKPDKDAFQRNKKIISDIRQKHTDQFPPYFAPQEGPTDKKPKNCSS